jgi:hypothetical protein
MTHTIVERFKLVQRFSKAADLVDFKELEPIINDLQTLLDSEQETNKKQTEDKLPEQTETVETEQTTETPNKVDEVPVQTDTKGVDKAPDVCKPVEETKVDGGTNREADNKPNKEGGEQSPKGNELSITFRNGDNVDKYELKSKEGFYAAKLVVSKL